MAASPSEAISYPSLIYPAVQANQILRNSDSPISEDSNTLSYGYDVPMSAAQRLPFPVNAAPNGSDCTAAFYAALDAAKACGLPAKICFNQAGRYYFKPGKRSDVNGILTITSATDLTIEGHPGGTVLVFGDPSASGMFLDRCNNVMLKDLIFDYNPLPFTQGKVKAADVNTGFVDIALDAGYPLPTEVFGRFREATGLNPVGCAFIVSANGTNWPSQEYVSLSVIEQNVGNGYWRFLCAPIDKASKFIRETPFVFAARSLGQMTLNVQESTKVYLTNVTVHASSTRGLGLMNNEGVNIGRYADTIPAGSNRMMASNADGMWLTGTRGGLIRNSYLWRPGDDCINLHESPAYANSSVAIDNPQGTQLTLHGQADVRPNDRLEIVQVSSATIKGQIPVAIAVRDLDFKNTHLTLQSSITGIYSSGSDQIYLIAAGSPRFKIINKYLGLNRGGSLFINARNGFIGGNTSENAESKCVTLGEGIGHGEGPTPSDIQIQGNLFRNTSNWGNANVITIKNGGQARNLSMIYIKQNGYSGNLVAKTNRNGGKSI